MIQIENLIILDLYSQNFGKKKKKKKKEKEYEVTKWHSP